MASWSVMMQPSLAPHNMIARWGWLIAIGIFASNLAQPVVLELPIKQLLKNEFGFGRDDVSWFLNIASIPWYFKFLVGGMSDCFPLAGTHRRSYLILGSVGASLAWLSVGAVPHSYWPLLFALMATHAMLVVISTVTAGLIVEAGKRYAAESKLVTIRVLVESICAIAAGPLAGFLTTLPFGWTGVAGALIAASAFPATLLLLQEPSTSRYDATIFAEARSRLRTLLTSRASWTVFVFLVIVSAPQTISSTLYFHQDELKLTGSDIGYLNALSGLGAVAATLTYGLARPRLSLRTVVAIGLISGALAVLLYMGYRSHNAARVIETAHGFLVAISLLAAMELIVAATPTVVASLGFALLASAWNVGAFIGDYFGSVLVQRGYLSFYELAGVYAVLSILTLCALPFLPAELFARNQSVAPDAD